MSGHSKWATTKHKKAIIDARRGKKFARLIKNIEVAARTGGGDPAGNPTLYDAIQKAKKNSVPNDNIERARKRGAGEEAGGADWQTITYEGYGPNGVAVLIECLTDNRNRAAGEVRVAMTRNGGNMADPGSVSYLFSRKGVVTLEKNGLTEDDVLTAVLEAGAEDVNDLGDSFEVICEPGDLVAVRTALQDAGIDYESAEASFQPSVSVPVDLDGARKVLRLVDALEDSDDVQDVYTNVDIPDDVAATSTTSDQPQAVGSDEIARAGVGSSAASLPENRLGDTRRASPSPSLRVVARPGRLDALRRQHSAGAPDPVDHALTNRTPQVDERTNIRGADQHRHPNHSADGIGHLQHPCSHIDVFGHWANMPASSSVNRGVSLPGGVGHPARLSRTAVQHRRVLACA